MDSAVLDACVLYSAPLRDLCMYLADLYQPKWSASKSRRMPRVYSSAPADILAKDSMTRVSIRSFSPGCSGSGRWAIGRLDIGFRATPWSCV